MGPYTVTSRPAWDTNEGLSQKTKNKTNKQKFINKTKQSVENETVEDVLFGEWAFPRVLWKF